MVANEDAEDGPVCEVCEEEVVLTAIVHLYIEVDMRFRLNRLCFEFNLPRIATVILISRHAHTAAWPF